jgi:magnesium-transporting ATPase (P-type)
MKKEERKKLIDFIISLLMLIGLMYCLVVLNLILVTALYSGESLNYPFDGGIINCSITGNNYNLDGLNLTWEGSIATIKTVINYQPDNFTLICWINKSSTVEEVITPVHHGGGGGSYIKPKNITNNSQQGNNSISNIETSNTSFFTPADNTLPPINNTEQTPLIKELKKGFNFLLWFIVGIVVLIVGVLIWYFIPGTKEEELLVPSWNVEI